MNKLQKTYIAAMSAAVLALLPSCKEGCTCHLLPGDSTLRAVVHCMADWSQFQQETPTGMTAICYDMDLGTSERRSTNSLSYAELRLFDGAYKGLVVNQSEGEFGFIELYSMSSLDSARVESTCIPMPSWVTFGGRMFEQPDWFAYEKMDSIIVTEEMIIMSAGGKCKCPDCECCSFHDPHPCEIGPFVPRNQIYTMNIKISIDEIQNLKLTRAAVSGLSGGIYFFNDSLKVEDGAVATTEFTTVIDPDDPHKGYVCGQLRTFGMPKDWKAIANSNILQAQFLLMDGQTIVNSQKPVGNLIRVNERDKTIDLELKLDDPLPNVAVGGGGGFNATVEDWGDVTDLDV